MELIRVLLVEDDAPLAQMMADARLDHVRSVRAGLAARRPPHDGRSFVVRLVCADAAALRAFEFLPNERDFLILRNGVISVADVDRAKVLSFSPGFRFAHTHVCTNSQTSAHVRSVSRTCSKASRVIIVLILLALPRGLQRPRKINRLGGRLARSFLARSR